MSNLGGAREAIRNLRIGRDGYSIADVEGIQAAFGYKTLEYTEKLFRGEGLRRAHGQAWPRKKAAS